MTARDDDLYGSGLTRRDWYALREVFLPLAMPSGFQAASQRFSSLTTAQRSSSVGTLLVRYFRTQEDAILEEALALMAPGASQVWLLLDKA
jgi:hypothetical protein